MYVRDTLTLPAEGLCPLHTPILTSESLDPLDHTGR